MGGMLLVDWFVMDFNRCLLKRQFRCGSIKMFSNRSRRKEPATKCASTLFCVLSVTLRFDWSIEPGTPQIAIGSTSIAQRTRLLNSACRRISISTGCQAAKNPCKALREWLSTSIWARSMLATRWIVMGTAG